MLHAVLVGINQYEDSDISPLRFARADAEALAALLKARIHPSETNVVVLTDAEATKRNVMVALGDTVRRLATAEDTLLLYFACHGSPEVSGPPGDPSRYLVAHDSQYEKARRSPDRLRRAFHLRSCCPRTLRQPRCCAG